MSQFGSNIQRGSPHKSNSDYLPQLANRQFDDVEMNLERDVAFSRQADGGAAADEGSNDAEDGASGDDEVRCIPKVMQVGHPFFSLLFHETMISHLWHI